MPIDAHDQIVLALIAIIATSVAGLIYVIRNNAIVKIAAQQATEANKAVNNVGPGEHRLYEVIGRIEAKQDDFDRKWGNLPPAIGDAVGLSEMLHGMDAKITDVQVELRRHVAWEQDLQGKYKMTGWTSGTHSADSP